MKPFAMLFVPLMAVGSYLAQEATGHGTPWWLFSLATLAAADAARRGRHSWFYSVMVVFFWLGCWLKVAVHHVLDYPYSEPTGSFSFAPREWDEYYQLATAIALALWGARMLFVIGGAWLSKRRQWAPQGEVGGNGSWWLWLGVVSVFYVINNLAAFFVTGVDPRVTLPFALNAPISFLALIGLAILTAMRVQRDVELHGRLRPFVLLMLFACCAIASVSMASRAAVLMQAVPIMLGVSVALKRQTGKALGLSAYVGLGVVLLAVVGVVLVYRMQTFSGVSAGNSELLGFYVIQNLILPIDRWIGAEALMVAASEPTASMDLFRQLLAEAPSAGVDAIYQRLAGSKYELLAGLTFLTLPGYFGVLGLSGSVPFVWLAVFALTAAGMSYEAWLVRWTRGQDAVVALVSTALANALTQMSFPVLVLPFLVQMTGVLLVLPLVSGRRLPRGPEAAEAGA